MAFLTINELTIKVKARDGDTGWVPLTDTARGVTGAMNQTQIDRKRTETLRTRPLSYQEGRALMALLKGHGHHWSFNSDLYSDGTGVINSAGSTSGAGSSAHTTKFGNYLALSAAEQLTYSIGLGSRYTVGFWLWDGGSSWDWFVFDDAGNKYKNGSTHGSAIGEVTVSGSNLLVGDGSNADDIDDLFVLYERMPSAWLSGWTPTQAFSDLPLLTCSGDLFDDVDHTMFATRVDASLPEFYDSNASAWENAAHAVQFTLEEA